jgi:hypothetical protein
VHTLLQACCAAAHVQGQQPARVGSTAAENACQITPFAALLANPARQLGGDQGPLLGAMLGNQIDDQAVFLQTIAQQVCSAYQQLLTSATADASVADAVAHDLSPVIQSLQGERMVKGISS